MDRLQRMLDAHPHPAPSDGDEALATILAAAECAHVCEACADACLAEENVAEMRACIRLNLDCAEVCATVSRILARTGHRDRPTLRALLDACATACRACADECDGHAEGMEHCRVCAEACRACEEACQDMTAVLVA